LVFSLSTKTWPNSDFLIWKPRTLLEPAQDEAAKTR
jgi:hypothetical protein